MAVAAVDVAIAAVDGRSRRKRGAEGLVPAGVFLHFRNFFKSEGVGSLCPLDYSFNSEVFPNLKVSTGLCPLDYSFISEAFSNLKVSAGLCPRDHSFISESFPNLKVSRGLCPLNHSFNSESFSNLKVSTGLCPPAHSFISESFSNLKVLTGLCPRDASGKTVWGAVICQFSFLEYSRYILAGQVI